MYYQNKIYDATDKKNNCPELRWRDTRNEVTAMITSQKFNQETEDTIGDAIDGKRKKRLLLKGKYQQKSSKHQ